MARLSRQYAGAVTMYQTAAIAQQQTTKTIRIRENGFGL
jgi:hypothetical protein